MSLSWNYDEDKIPLFKEINKELNAAVFYASIWIICKGEKESIV